MFFNSRNRVHSQHAVYLRSFLNRDVLIKKQTSFAKFRQFLIFGKFCEFLEIILPKIERSHFRHNLGLIRCTNLRKRSPRSYQHPDGNLLAYVATFKEFATQLSSFPGFPVTCHWKKHEDYPFVETAQIQTLTLPSCSESTLEFPMWVILGSFPLEYHLFSICSTQFFEKTCFQTPLIFVFANFHLYWFWTDASHTWYKIRKDESFGFHDSNSLITQQKWSSPHKLVLVNRGQSCDLRLLFDGLLSRSKQVLHRLRRLNLWRIVNSLNNLVQDELELEMWQTWKYTNYCVHIDVIQIIPRFPITKSFSRIRRLSPCEVDTLVIWKWLAENNFWSLILLNLLLEFWDFLNVHGIQLPQFLCADDRFFLSFQILLILARGHKFPYANEQLSISLSSLTNPTLRQNWNFDFVLASRLRDNLTYPSTWSFEYPQASQRNWTVHQRKTCSNRTGQVQHRWPGFRHNPVLLWRFLHPFRHPFGVQLRKLLRFLVQQRELKWLTLNKDSVCHVWNVLWQYLCDLVLGVKSTCSEFWCPILFGHANNQQKLCESLTHVSLLDSGPWWSFCSLLHYPQTNTTSKWTEKIWCLKAHYQCETLQNYRAWMELWLDSFVWTWRDATSLCWWIFGFTRWFGLQWNTSVTFFKRSKTGIPFIRSPVPREFISAPLHNGKLKPVVLHIQLHGTKVWLPKIHNSPTDVDFEPSEITNKIIILKWSKSTLLAVFPTRQHHLYVRDQTNETLVACSHPFCDGAGKFIHSLITKNIRSTTNLIQMQHFRKISRILLTILQQIVFLLLAKLLNWFMYKFGIFSTHFFTWSSMS